MTVILRPLAAAAVLPVILQKAIQRPARLPDHTAAHRLIEGQGKCAQEHVLRAPGCPVVHFLVPVSHPPEMLRQIRGQDAPVYLQKDPIPHRLRQMIRKDSGGTGKQCAGLRGKEVDNRPGDIRPRSLRRIPHIGIVSRKLPGALLAQRPNGIDRLLQPPGILFQQEAAHQIRQPPPARKIEAFKVRAVSGAGKGQPVTCQNTGQRRLLGARRAGQCQFAFLLRQMLQVCMRRHGANGMQNLRERTQLFFKHIPYLLKKPPYAQKDAEKRFKAPSGKFRCAACVWRNRFPCQSAPS